MDGTMKKALLIFLIFIAVILYLPSCHKGKNTKQTAQQTVTATMQSIPTNLFYSGIVSPIQVYNVPSPTDGTIKVLNVKYGQRVVAGDQLLIISSSKLQTDYRSALTDYLKAAEDYNNAKINFRGTQELLNAQIISMQEYLSDKEQYDSTVLAFLNAKFALEQILKKIPGAQKMAIEKLSPQDTETLSKILQVQSSDLVIKADRPGVVLSPQKGSDGADGGGDGDGGSGDDSSNKTIQVGNQVKEGQTLVSLGDLSGISTTVQVSEMVINQIKPGQNVTVTLDALPSLILKGAVKSVGAQAQSAEGGQSAVATFPVTVVVPLLPEQQKQLIRVGMTMKVQITIQNPPQLMIPIAAVHENNGMSMVTVLDHNNKPQEVPVVTGQTNLSDVAILQGLKTGDRVVVPALPPPTAPQ